MAGVLPTDTATSGGEMLADLESIQHIYVTNEFERQVLARISSSGFHASKLAKYFFENFEKEGTVSKHERIPTMHRGGYRQTNTTYPQQRRLLPPS